MHRFEVQAEGVAVLGGYLHRTFVPGAIMSLCRRHRRQLLSDLGLVSTEGDDVDGDPEWTRLERLVFEVLTPAKRPLTALLMLAVLGVITTGLLATWVVHLARGDWGGAAAAAGLGGIAVPVAVAHWRHWRRLVRRRTR